MSRPTRRVGLSTVVAALLVVAGILVSLWRPLAPSLPAVPTNLDQLAPRVAAAISAYRDPRVVVTVVLQALAVAVPVLVVATPAGRRLLDRLAGRRSGGWRGPVRGAVVAVGIGLLGLLVALPFRAWAGLVQDGTWGVRTASALEWWARLAATEALELGVLGLLGAGVVWLVRRRPRRWVGDAVVLGVLAVAVMTLVWPAVVLPLTTPIRPLGSTDQAQAVRATLAAADLEELEVVVSLRSRRDTRSNAVVHGLGPSRRVVIDDNLLAAPVDEVVAVVAHELAHQRHRDVERAVLASSLLVLLLAVGVRLAWSRPAVRRRLGAHLPGPIPDHDPRLAAVVLAVVAVLTPVASPVALWQSRRVEAAADAGAHDLGAEPATMVRLQRRLARDNLTPMVVPGWQYVLWWSHPTPAERVRAAVARAAVIGAPLPDLDDLLAQEAADPPAWSPPGRALR